MIAISKLAAFLSLASLSLAVPLTGLNAGQTGNLSQYKPIFPETPVSIVLIGVNDSAKDQILEWSAENHEGSPVHLRSQSIQETLQTGDFIIEPTGQPEQNYKIR